MAVQNSMELASSSCDDDGHPSRTGNLWSCVAHIITAVIGSGVLSLAWSTAQLGWIAGPIALLCFAIVTYISAFLLSDCYRSPDPVTGTRNYCYMDAVRVNLGKTQTWFCGLLQYLSMYGTCVAYVITTSTSMRAIQRSNCYHREGHKAACAYGDNFFMLVVGLVQIIVSQIPDIHSIEWLSVVAAIMSFAYSFIGFGLGFAKVLAFGDKTPGNLLTGFGFFEPYWLIDFANACVLIHLIYSQPVFSFVEGWFSNKYPRSGFVNEFYTFKLPLFPPLQVNLLRVCFRTAYVASTTAIAMVFPYFNQVLGVLGALNFWPLAIYFPVEMYFVQKKIGPWTRKWIVLRTFSVVCLLVTILGLIGSIQGIIRAKLR
ncbi:hypothetical protein JCGZ_09546 [Jatropha curcas]|uniref:Amino acid transporter transmembrane domain-containing protein n=1 Tax=Jatropha curcas TaxID=180498 RepID=A0A067KJC9_JATCU|nr:hypothetical protein JCGZ_09546 [Jatropha curcas]